jgi:spore coat polysaccharide biosynthesis predicted glycosyltransferase SpsG
MDLVRALAAKSRRLAAIDDLHQLSHAEVKWIIRPSVGERSSARVLGGARFVLLRREWWQLRRRAPRESVRGVFIALGSAPQHRDLVTAVEAVRRTVPEAVIDVASGIRTFDAPSGVRSHPMSRSLRPLLAHVDLAVSAAGQTMYECLASRVPTVVVCTAENQRRQLAATMRAGAALDGGTAGSDGWNEALMATVARLLPAARRVRMTAHQEALIDGRGALRVARALAEAAE